MVPSEKAAKHFIPASIPISDLLGCSLTSISFSTYREAYHLPPLEDTVIFLMVPEIWQLL